MTNTSGTVLSATLGTSGYRLSKKMYSMWSFALITEAHIAHEGKNRRAFRVFSGKLVHAARY